MGDVPFSHEEMRSISVVSAMGGSGHSSLIGAAGDLIRLDATMSRSQAFRRSALWAITVALMLNAVLMSTAKTRELVQAMKFQDAMLQSGRWKRCDRPNKR